MARNEEFKIRDLVSLLISNECKQDEVTSGIVSSLIAYHKENVYPKTIVVETKDGNGNPSFHKVNMNQDNTYSTRTLTHDEYVKLTGKKSEEN